MMVFLLDSPQLTNTIELIHIIIMQLTNYSSWRLCPVAFLSDQVFLDRPLLLFDHIHCMLKLSQIQSALLCQLSLKC